MDPALMSHGAARHLQVRTLKRRELSSALGSTFLRADSGDLHAKLIEGGCCKPGDFNSTNISSSYKTKNNHNNNNNNT